MIVEYEYDDALLIRDAALPQVLTMEHICMSAVLEQFKSVVSIINDLHSMPDCFALRRDHLLESFSWIFDSSIAVMGLASEISSGYSFRNVGIVGDDNRLTQEQIYTLLGGESGVLSQLLAQRPSVVAITQQELVEDEAWKESSLHNNMIKPQAVGDGMWCICVASEISSEFIAIALYRPASSPFPFANRDRKVLEILMGGLRWMFAPQLHPQYTHHSSNYGMELAPRLQRLLDCLIDGRSEKQAARQLALTKHTVHTYVKELYRVLGVSSRAELFAKAAKRSRLTTHANSMQITDLGGQISKPFSNS